ncbi:MarR family transcriptional regulator [Pikeienuella piscinae]|uniref:MarR family transcriptional regulator n=2 Tax=Pikeienuella piscinae TaxID=2748098 RepID=A0A7L5BXJ0_9RHOB|nr:MarR family transcriptional regulator [Pikeienuella piscinae]
MHPDESATPETTETGPDPFGGRARLCFSIYAAHHALNRVYQPLLEALGLTYPQYLAMAALWTRDGLSVGEIGRALGLESSTLTPLLKRLEAAGLIRRERAKTDERVVTVVLTGEGRALGEKAAHVPECVLAATRLDRAEMERLSAALNELRAALDGREEAGRAGADRPPRRRTRRRAP